MITNLGTRGGTISPDISFSKKLRLSSPSNIFFNNDTATKNTTSQALGKNTGSLSQRSYQVGAASSRQIHAMEARGRARAGTAAIVHRNATNDNRQKHLGGGDGYRESHARKAHKRERRKRSMY